MPSPEIKTLILRFRDLVTRPGDTIAQHQAIAEKQGLVWWGWWNKAGETVPDETFRAIAEAAESPQGLEILLLDSDRGQLFGALCKELRWDARTRPLDAPGPSPSYYRDRSCLAWFQFESIGADPLPESILNRYSYVKVPEFFEAGESGYGAFYGKRIDSVRELLQQNRTIWFARDAQPGDPVHSISLLDSHRIEPSDFPREPLVSASTDLLWVSDLHFSDDGHHAFPLHSDDSSRTAWASVERSLRENSIPNVAGVIASGDFAWKAAASEFEKARSFFDGAKSWGMKSYDFLICPGNHDIAFSDDPADKDQPVSVARDVARAAFESFYQDLFFKKPNQFLSCGRRFLLGGAIPVEVACLNSSLLDQQKDLFQGHGFVGDDQMDDAAKQLGWEPQSTRPRAVRIVVLHHHLLPVTYREIPLRQRQYSVTLDAEALTRWLLLHEVDVVLHGHQHQPFYTNVLRPIDLEVDPSRLHDLAIVGLGSTGVRLDHLGEIKNNMFAVLSFGPREVLFRFFSIHPIDPSKLLFQFRLDLSTRNRLA